VTDPADPATFDAAVLDLTLTEREPHRSRLAMYTELLRVRRGFSVLTDQTAQQHVSIVGDTVYVVRSTPTTTASLIFNFSSARVEHPAPDDADTIVFDTDDERWRGNGFEAGTIGAWSGRLSVGHDR
jgi:hypothetical protein